MFILFLVLANSYALADFDAAYASKAVKLSLECVDQEHPNHYDRFYSSKKPREIHPAFFGCYDWHSAVHGHWAMLRVLHRFPAIAEAAAIKSALNKHLTADLLRGELAHFEKEPGFERPYGYGWFLRLVEEIESSPLPEAKKWRENVRPLEKLLVDRTMIFLSKLVRPMREGMHANTAYALAHIWDYAKRVKNQELQEAIRVRAKLLYGKDVNCPLSYEPSAADFISPCFVEAELMGRVLSRAEFRAWFKKFMPKLSERDLEPVIPLDVKDYQLGHLVGLLFQKAASLQAVNAFLGGKEKRLLQSAEKHAEAAWRLMFESGYGGTHWLASFAIYYYSSVSLDAVSL
jgi:hypothetical protein